MGFLRYIPNIHAHNRPVGFDLKSVVREYFRFRLPPYATHYFACGQEAGDWLFGVKNRSKVIQERNAVDTALYRYDPTVAEEVRAEFQTPRPRSRGPFLPSEKSHAACGYLCCSA